MSAESQVASTAAAEIARGNVARGSSSDVRGRLRVKLQDVIANATARHRGWLQFMVFALSPPQGEETKLSCRNETRMVTGSTLGSSQRDAGTLDSFRKQVLTRRSDPPPRKARSKQPARPGRIPKTGEAATIRPRRVVTFTPGGKVRSRAATGNRACRGHSVGQRAEHRFRDRRQTPARSPPQTGFRLRFRHAIALFRNSHGISDGNSYRSP